MTTHEPLEAPADLNGRHQLTWKTIFRHPAAHNLEWHDVRSLLDALADVAEETDGSLHVKRNGMFLVIHPPRFKDLGTVDELLDLRRFLEKSNVSPGPLMPK
jgi:hypothetical protein